jgi:glycosyltransferase involved in cell wall biosynthesis
MQDQTPISVIVSTYNRPRALFWTLLGLKEQTDKNFEVIVADDGSTNETRQLIEEFQKDYPVPLVHAWQEDLGFRLAAVRNTAVKKARGKYFIFMDGDCIPMRNYVKNHRSLAEPRTLVAGNRLLLSRDLTAAIEEKTVNPLEWHCSDWLRARINGGVNRLLPLVSLPNPLRNAKPARWQRVRGCNFALAAKDVWDIDGFDEAMKGWGFEDSEFALRFINNGGRIKSGTFSTGLCHLWHREGNKEKAGPNWDRVQFNLQTNNTHPLKGLSSSDKEAVSFALFPTKFP